MEISYEVCRTVAVTTTDSERIYHTPDGDFPSVTTILSATDDNRWLAQWQARVGEEEAERIRRQTAERGTLIHSYLERALNGEDIADEISKGPRDVRTMTLGLLEVMRKNVTSTYVQELTVWNRDMGYAGRLDFVGEWNRAPAMIEFKTSKRKKYGKAAEKCLLQATAYALAYNSLFRTNIETIVTLVAIVDGGIQIIEDHAENFFEILSDRVGEYHRGHTA
jgi:genome maintenance exonuclease 1